MAPIVAALLPTLLKAITSPLVAGTAAAWIGKKAGLSESTIEAATNFINGLDPTDQLKIKQLDQEFERFVLEQDNKLVLAELGLLTRQMDINASEAGHQSIFVAGWRPFVGWIGGIGLGYVAIVEPILRFGAKVVFGYDGDFPVIDTTITMQVLTGLLGLGLFRTMDKKNGKTIHD